MVCLEDLVTLITRGEPSLVPKVPSPAGATDAPSAVPLSTRATDENGHGQAQEPAGGAVSSNLGSSTGGRQQGGQGGAKGERLHGDVRWAFMCLLDSLFFSVKEPVPGLDRHSAIHALLDSLLAVSYKLRPALAVVEIL